MVFSLREPLALFGDNVPDQLARLAHQVVTATRANRRRRGAQSARTVIHAPDRREVFELLGDHYRERIQARLLSRVRNESSCGCERVVHIRGGAPARIEVGARPREEIAALRRLGIGEPREHGLERLRDIPRDRDGIAGCCEPCHADEREHPDCERHKRGPDCRGDSKSAAGDHQQLRTSMLGSKSKSGGTLVWSSKKTSEPPCPSARPPGIC